MNVGFLLIFLAAHLFGDFVLQTDKIAKMKSESIKGLTIHCTLVLIMQIILLSSFGLRGALIGVLSGFSHFLIDFMKMRLNKYLKNRQFIYFIADQMIHISIIYALTIYFAPASDILRNFHGYLKIIISLITIIYVSTVAAKILIRDLYVSQSKEVFFKRHERIFDSVTAVVLFTVWIIPALFSILIVIAAFYPYLRLQKSVFAFKTDISIMKYLVYTITGFVMAFFMGLV